MKAGILLGFRLPGMTDRRDGPILAAPSYGPATGTFGTVPPMRRNVGWTS